MAQRAEQATKQEPQATTHDEPTITMTLQQANDVVMVLATCRQNVLDYQTVRGIIRHLGQQLSETAGTPPEQGE